MNGFPNIIDTNAPTDGVCNYDAVTWFKNIEFGSSVALDDNKLVVGSSKNTKLYEITRNANSTNIQEEHTFASTGATDVDINGNYVADSNGLYSNIGANDWQTKLTFTADKVSISTEHFAISFANKTTDVYKLSKVKRLVREPLDGIYNSVTHGRSEISQGISISNPVNFNGSLTVVHNNNAWSIQNTSVEQRTLGQGSGQQKYAIACQQEDKCSHGQCVEQEQCSNIDASVPIDKSCVCGILKVKFGDDSNEYYRGNKCQAGDYCYEETKTCSDVPKCTSSLVNDRCLCGIDICNSREYCDLQSGLCHKDGAGLQQCAYTSGKIENDGHLCKCGNSVCFKNPLDITSSDNYYGMYCQKDAHTCSPNPRDDKQFILNQIYVENTEILSQKMCMHAIENLDTKFPTFQIKDRFAVYIANLRTLPVGCFYDQQEEVMWLNTMPYDHSERAALVSADTRIEPIYKSTWPNPDNVHCPKPWRCVFIDRDTMNIKSMTWSCKLPDGTSSETCDRKHHLGCFNGKCMPIRNCKTGLNTETCYCGTETCYKNNNNQWITPSSYVNTNEDSLWCSMNQGIGSCSKNKPDTSDKYVWSHVPFSQQDYVSLDDISVGNITLKEDCEAFANKKSYAFTNSTEGPAGCSIQLKKIIQGSEFVYYKTRPPLTVQFNSDESSTTECKTSLKNHSDINWVEEIDRVCVHKALSECGDDSVKSPCKCEAIDIWKTNICKVGEYCNNGECSAKKCLTTSPTQSKYTAFMSEQLLGTCTCGQKTCNIDENGTFACKQGECALLECPESNTDKQNQLTHRCTCGTNTCAPRQFCEKTTQSVEKICSSWWCTSSTYIIREPLYTCKNYLSVPGLDLTGADLTGANLSGADLTGTTLTEANLTGANLSGADLTGVILTGADLTGADLTNTFSKGLVGIPAKLPDYWFIMKGFLVSTTTTPNNSQLSEMFNDGVGDYIENILLQTFIPPAIKCTIDREEFAEFDEICNQTTDRKSPVIDGVHPLYLPDGWFLMRIGHDTHLLGSGGNYYSSVDALEAVRGRLILLQNNLDGFAWGAATQYAYTLEDCEYIKNKNTTLADKQIYSSKTINVTGCFYNTLYNFVYFNEGSPSDMELDINVTKYPDIRRLYMVTCDNGYYDLNKDGLVCMQCYAGFADIDLNPATECTACATGTYAGESATACDICAAGQYDHDSDPVTECTACANGTYSIAGQTTCGKCAHGTMIVGQACVECAVGFADIDLNPATNCTACATGTYAGESATACDICAAGQYDHDSDPATSCNTCGAGTYTIAGQTTCVECPAGFADDDENPATECLACDSDIYAPYGTYAPYGSTACYDCTAGKYDHDSDPASSCRYCPAGKFQNQIRQNLCQLCPAGTYATYGSTACDNCAAGQYDHDSDPATSCNTCGAGTYTIAGQTTCVECPAGFADIDWWLIETYVAERARACVTGTFAAG